MVEEPVGQLELYPQPLTSKRLKWVRLDGARYLAYAPSGRGHYQTEIWRPERSGHLHIVVFVPDDDDPRAQLVDERGESQAGWVAIGSDRVAKLREVKAWAQRHHDASV